MDISKLISHSPLGKTESSIGTLYIFSLTYGHQIQFFKNIDWPINKCEPEHVIRILSMFACYPEATLVEGKHKPESTVLTRTDVEKLSGDDIEKIACIYLEGNDYLYRERIPKTTKTDKGTYLSSEKGDNTYPKEKGESCVKYLHRLLIIQEKKQIEKFKKIAEPYSHFSDTLKKSIGESLALGESLKKSFSTVSNVEIRPIERVMSSIDFAEIERNKELQRLKPFKELNNRLDRLIETSTQASEFQIETHKVQTGIAEELKASGDSAAKFSRENISLSKIVIILTILGIFITLYIHISNQNESSQKDKISLSQATEIVTLLEDIKTNITISNKQQQIMRDLQEQNEKQTERLRLLEERFAEIKKKQKK